ncbi:twin-arginine translocation signal domain-containing protein [Bradyrhizobium cajani]|uniref:Twin-arginine translocation signal domain-containing protein n=1 Tax=Bradyrhizobium cajani TaxID=1928661 RepID=A0A844TF65_9BRAD|nr:twin-arginine translocation signal domain-containing protein [Bradyrhizobium cajani]MCP3372261.1 twin-arginine translocation signal domain-containing protein [Bradyrhizobium cajani]MVT73260.1 twin-arginine translocation signal domain-containing protein [Bradyrhizobium cajani]
MERRNFLKLALGVTAGAAAFAATAQAAPLPPQPLGGPAGKPDVDAHQAVTTSEEAAQLQPEQVHWRGRGRHWGWRHRHWRHRHWGWRRRHWHRRRYW